MTKQSHKILLIGPRPPAVGGISSFITSLQESSLNKKYSLMTYNTSRVTSVKSRFKLISNSTNMFHASFLTLYHLLSFPTKLISTRPHLVHINTPSYLPFWESTCYVIFAKLFRIPVIFHIHGGAFDKFYLKASNLQKNAIRIAMNLPDEVIALSKFWRIFFEKTIGISSKVIVINNFVSTSKYPPSQKSLPESGSKVEVLFFGGTDPKRKGLYTLLDSIPQVIKELPNVHFNLVCKNDFYLINKIIKDSKINASVCIFSEVSEEEKIKLLHLSDIFVLPTFSEGLPIALLEAMSVGLPIISTPVGAIPEVMEDGKNGFLVAPGDVDSLTKKIILLAKNSSLRQSFRLNNVDRITKNFDQNLIVCKIDKIYDQLVNN